MGKVKPDKQEDQIKIHIEKEERDWKDKDGKMEKRFWFINSAVLWSNTVSTFSISVLNLVVYVEEGREGKYGTNDRLIRILDIKSNETMIKKTKLKNQKARKTGISLIFTKETI